MQDKFTFQQDLFTHISLHKKKIALKDFFSKSD